MEIKLQRSHFYDPLKIQRLNGLTLVEAVYPPNQVLPRHSHERSCFMVVIQGSFSEIYRSKTILGKPATLIFRPSGEVHSDRFYNHGGRLLIIEMEHGWLERVYEHSATLNELADFSTGFLRSLAYRVYKEFREMDCVSPLVIEGLILEIIGETSRRSADVSDHQAPYWLKQAKELLHAQFPERVTIGYIGKVVGVHPVHLGQAFRKFYRCNPGEYVRQLRVDFACHELATSDTPLAQIALAAGFSDQSHLTRTLKRHTGMTPTQYRSLLRVA